jgi:hypothetical protein
MQTTKGRTGFKFQIESILYYVSIKEKAGPDAGRLF